MKPSVAINYLITLPDLSYQDAARLMGTHPQTLKLMVSSDLFRACFLEEAKAANAFWAYHWSDDQGEVVQDIHEHEQRRRLERFNP